MNYKKLSEAALSSDPATRFSMCSRRLPRNGNWSFSVCPLPKR